MERACFSGISALSRSPMTRWGSCWAGARVGLGLVSAFDGGGYDLIEGGLHAVRLSSPMRSKSWVHPIRWPSGVAQRQSGGHEDRSRRAGSRWRARMLRRKSVERTPWLRASAQAAATAGSASGEHRVEDVDHLPIAIVGASELASRKAPSFTRQYPRAAALVPSSRAFCCSISDRN
jgi:hypothetical protein